MNTLTHNRIIIAEVTKMAEGECDLDKISAEGRDAINEWLYDTCIDDPRMHESMKGRTLDPDTYVYEQLDEDSIDEFREWLLDR